MSYVDPLHTSMAVSEEQLVRGGDEVMEYVRREMVEELTHFAHEHGHPHFDPTAVRFSTRRPDAHDNTVTFRLDWCPQPERPVEFLGGPQDGALQILPPDVRHWTVLAPPAPPAMANCDPANDDVPSIVTYTYTRAGINPVTNRWVMTLRGKA